MIDLRSSETEPTLQTDESVLGTAPDLRTPFQNFKTRLPGKQRPSRVQLRTVPKRGRFYDVAADILGIKTGISNVYLLGAPASAHWVLVDAGMPGFSSVIIAAAERRFGAHIPPSAIILTNGHFDHAGTLGALTAYWDVPIYAHPLEMPYLTGRSSYPPADPSVGHGTVALLSSLFPTRPIDLGPRVRVLPKDGHISQLPGWKWIHTPGHSAGHISLYNEDNRVLIAGDAVTTVRAESLLANLTLTPELHGPPTYLTPDWTAARDSVRMLADLDPDVLATGHGIPLHGEMMRFELRQLARDFALRGVPDYGRYVREAATADETGVLSVPPSLPQPGRSLAMVLAGMAVGFAAGMLLMPRRRASLRDLGW